jgi:predicted DNA-binding ribbon-helix-helix protein
MARRGPEYIAGKDGKKVLPSFNIRIGKHRTSVRLSPVVADAVEQIADRERCALHELYTYIDRTKEKGVSRSSAIRDFALEYFMDAATESGHRREGHGKLIGQATPQARAAAKKRRSKA